MSGPLCPFPERKDASGLLKNFWRLGTTWCPPGHLPGQIRTPMVCVMSGREIGLWVCGLVVVTALTIFGTVKAVEWYATSDNYGPGLAGTGVLPKTK